jgi:hypothetical protein
MGVGFERKITRETKAKGTTVDARTKGIFNRQSHPNVSDQANLQSCFE